jgi:hypothetical protein
MKTDVSLSLEPKVDFSVPLDIQVDVLVPLEQQMNVSPHSEMYHQGCTKNQLFQTAMCFFIYLHF